MITQINACHRYYVHKYLCIVAEFNCNSDSAALSALIIGRGHEKIMTYEIISFCANQLQWPDILADLIIRTG